MVNLFIIKEHLHGNFIIQKLHAEVFGNLLEHSICQMSLLSVNMKQLVSPRGITVLFGFTLKLVEEIHNELICLLLSVYSVNAHDATCMLDMGKFCEQCFILNESS